MGILVYLWIRASRNRREQAFAVGFLLLIVTSVALGRLTLGAHWPSDFLAGVVIGAAWLGVLIVALRRGRDRSRPAPHPRQ